MRIEAGEPCPLPDDLVLAEWATAMGDRGWIVDPSWNLRFITEDHELDHHVSLTRSDTRHERCVRIDRLVTIETASKSHRSSAFTFNNRSRPQSRWR